MENQLPATVLKPRRRAPLAESNAGGEELSLAQLLMNETKIRRELEAKLFQERLANCELERLLERERRNVLEANLRTKQLMKTMLDL